MQVAFLGKCDDQGLGPTAHFPVCPNFLQYKFYLTVQNAESFPFVEISCTEKARLLYTGEKEKRSKHEGSNTILSDLLSAGGTFSPMATR